MIKTECINRLNTTFGILFFEKYCMKPARPLPMLRHIPLLLLYILTSFNVVRAQSYEPLASSQSTSRSDFYQRQQVEVAANRFYSLNPDFAFTSVAVSINKNDSFDGAYLIVAQDTVFLREDEHQPEQDSIRQSRLVILASAQPSFLFFSASIAGKVSFSLINASQGQAEATRRMRQMRKQQYLQTEGCEQPLVIPQSVWRQGLPAPSYQRVETNVRHVIVHHSAGSNTNTDYTNTVRNIYLFHTRDRGWSDIGYNFLIGQDGSIFQGRSFGDSSLETGDIRGAHFCGQNSGTMGICLLGNFNTAVPSDTSIASLRQLMSWKLQKESLPPLERFPHPANANLGVIAAHQNGCATECPGDNLYAIMDKLRLSVATSLENDCGTPAPVAFAVYPVPAQNTVNVNIPTGLEPDTFWLIDAVGQRQEVTAVLQEASSNWVVELGSIRTGMYVLQVDGTGFCYERKLLVQ